MSLFYQILITDRDLIIAIILKDEYVSPNFLKKLTFYLLNEGNTVEILIIFGVIAIKASLRNSVH